MSWVPFALVAACFVGGHYLLLRAAAGRISDVAGALLLEGAATIGIALYGIVRGGFASGWTRAGALAAVASGVCISATSILLFATLRRGGPVASTGTLVLGGGVVLSAVLAPLLFGEAVTARRAVGVLLGVAGMIVLATEKA